MADEREPATTHADLYQRHGDPDPEQWEEQEAVTGRPNDTPLDDPQQPYAVENSTLAERAKQRKQWEAKKVDDAENKAVQSADNKGGPVKPPRSARKRK